MPSGKKDQYDEMIAPFKDWLHELRIRIACRLMLWHHERRQKAQANFFRLIRARRPSQVARMEQEKGLV